MFSNTQRQTQALEKEKSVYSHLAAIKALGNLHNMKTYPTVYHVQQEYSVKNVLCFNIIQLNVFVYTSMTDMV